MIVSSKAAAISPATKWTLQRISGAGNWSPLFTQRKAAQGQYKARIATNTSYFWAHWPLGGARRGCTSLLRLQAGRAAERWNVPSCERAETGHTPGEGLAHIQRLPADFRHNQLSIIYRELKWPWLSPALLAMVQCYGEWCRGQVTPALLDVLAAAAAEKLPLAFAGAEGSKFAQQVSSLL